MASGSRSSDRSSTRETTLSKQQASILKQREAQYQSVFFPELVSQLEQTKSDELGRNPRVAQATGDVGKAYQASQKQFQTAAAQRGLKGSGFEVLGLAALEGARSSKLADVMAAARAENKQTQLGLLQMGGSLSPTPTQAAPMGETRSQRSSAWGSVFTSS